MLERIKEFYSTKRTPKIVVTILIIVLLISGVTCATLYQTTSKSDDKIADKSTKETSDKDTQDTSKEEKDKKTDKEDKKKAEEDKAKADEEATKEATSAPESTPESTSNTPSADSAKSNSTSGTENTSSNTGNTSNKHEHNWVAKTIYHEATLSVNHIETTPAVTKDVVYIVYADGCEGPASNVEADRMHNIKHPGVSSTTVTRTEIITPEHSYVVEDVPFKPGYNETIYTCSCGATK